MTGVQTCALPIYAGAKPGDHLVLTKAIGTGLLSTALKRDLMTGRDIEPAVESMEALNDGAAAAMRTAGDAIHAATDVTGFGLLGHLGNILRASKVGARLNAGHVPLLPKARDAVELGAISGGTERNMKSTEAATRWSASLDKSYRVLLNDAQTSGGLLIAVDSSRSPALVGSLRELGDPITAAVIGEVSEGHPGITDITD